MASIDLLGNPEVQPSMGGNAPCLRPAEPVPAYSRTDYVSLSKARQRLIGGFNPS